jgi:hypothetical protein
MKYVLSKSGKLTYLVTLLSLLTVLVYVGMAQADIVTDGLVAYWSLDASTIAGKDVEDIVGDNDGVINGKPKEIAAGKINEALEFDGQSSVDIVGTDALNFSGKEELSVCCWVKAEDADDPVVGVVANPGGCCGTIIAQRDANGWALRYDGRNPGNEMEFIVCPGWQGDGGFGTPKFAKGEWHYLAGIVDRNKVYLYLDGELVNEAPFGGPISSNGSETEIGHAGDGGFVGVIDEVAIYDRALTKEEVEQNFASKRFLAVDIEDKLAICWGDIKR